MSYVVTWKQSWYCDTYSGSDDHADEFDTLTEAKQHVAKLNKDPDNYSIKILHELE